MSAQGNLYRISKLGQTIESSEITDDTIVNADIKSDAAIAKSKLAALGIVDADVTGISASKIDAGLLPLARGGLAFAPVLAGNASKAIKVNAGETALELAAAAGGATTVFTEDTLSADFTTTSATFVDITGLTITLGATGKFLVFLNAGVYNGGAAGTAPVLALIHDATEIRRMGQGSPAASMSMVYSMHDGGTSNSTIIKPQINAPVNTTTVRGTGNYLSAFFTMEIS
jgi:hypothetical protein